MSEINIEIKTEILSKFETLNLETFVLICKIDRYKDKMTEPLYKCMTEQLVDLYKKELEKMTRDYNINHENGKHEEKVRKAVFVAKRTGFFRRWNKAAKLIEQKVAQEADEFFTHGEKLLSKPDEAALPPQVEDRGQKPVSENVANDQSRQAAPPTCENAPPTPQKPRKQGSRGKDRAADETPISPKSGKGKKKQ